jgi:hypothetical protein
MPSFWGWFTTPQNVLLHCTVTKINSIKSNLHQLVFLFPKYGLLLWAQVCLCDICVFLQLGNGQQFWFLRLLFKSHFYFFIFHFSFVTCCLSWNKCVNQYIYCFIFSSIKSFMNPNLNNVWWLDYFMNNAHYIKLNLNLATIFPTPPNPLSIVSLTTKK